MHQHWCLDQPHLPLEPGLSTLSGRPMVLGGLGQGYLFLVPTAAPLCTA